MVLDWPQIPQQPQKAKGLQSLGRVGKLLQKSKHSHLIEESGEVTRRGGR